MHNHQHHHQRRHRWVILAVLAAAAVTWTPSSVRADDDHDGDTAACKVSYYLTAPYDDDTGNYNHVVVFQDDCDVAVECDLVSEGATRTVTLDGTRVNRVTVSRNNEQPSFDATATCVVLP